MNISITEKQRILKQLTPEEKAQKIVILREKARIRAKKNYLKRKEEGRQKQYYKPVQEKRYKAPPTEEELKELKYFKVKEPKQATIKLSIEEYNKLKALLEDKLIINTL